MDGNSDGMSQSYISLGRAKALVEEIVTTSAPGTRNAMSGSTCTYLDSKGHRCIVGEVLHRMKMPPPEWNGAFEAYGDSGVAYPYINKGYMSSTTAEWLGRLQGFFDGDTEATPTWRAALKAAKRDGLFS